MGPRQRRPQLRRLGRRVRDTGAGGLALVLFRGGFRRCRRGVHGLASVRGVWESERMPDPLLSIMRRFTCRAPMDPVLRPLRTKAQGPGPRRADKLLLELW